MKIKELEAKIAALEKKIEELQKSKPTEVHHHHYSSYPVYVYPSYPQPYIPWVTYMGGTGGTQMGTFTGGTINCTGQLNDLSSQSLSVNRCESLMNAAQ